MPAPPTATASRYSRLHAGRRAGADGLGDLCVGSGARKASQFLYADGFARFMVMESRTMTAHLRL